MKAARLHSYGQPLQIDEAPTPSPGPGEVLVAIRGAGFWHSDIHVIDGEIQILPRLPLVLGHENAVLTSRPNDGANAGIHTGASIRPSISRSRRSTGCV